MEKFSLLKAKTQANPVIFSDTSQKQTINQKQFLMQSIYREALERDVMGL
jgi:hypothetical protein